MEITILDFVLINIISYVCGTATGLIICCKNKDKLLIKSKSLDNLSKIIQPVQSSISTPIIAESSTIQAVPSAPSAQITKITLE